MHPETHGASEAISSVCARPGDSQTVGGFVRHAGTVRLPPASPHAIGGREAMPLIHLSVQHGHTFDEAKRRLETAVHEIQSRFSTLVQQVEWSTDRSQVRLEDRILDRDAGGCAGRTRVGRHPRARQTPVAPSPHVSEGNCPAHLSARCLRTTGKHNAPVAFPVHCGKSYRQQSRGRRYGGRLRASGHGAPWLRPRRLADRAQVFWGTV